MSLDFTRAFQLAEAQVADQKEESLKRQAKMMKAHLDRVNTNLTAHKDRKREEAMAKLFKEEVIMERNEKVLGRYRIVHNKTGEVMGSHDDRTQALAMGKKCGGFPHVRMEDSEKAA
jgi:hypothetical protein